MLSPKEIEENIKSTYSLLTERGILGGMYFGLMTFCMLLSVKDFQVFFQNFPWVLLVSTIIGIIISNISYELFLPVFRISNKIVLNSANNILVTKFANYKTLRKFREDFLAEDSNSQLKGRIKVDEKQRQTLTYLASTCIVTFLFHILIYRLYETDSRVVIMVFSIAGFVMISTFIGIIARANSLGCYIGLAQLKKNG